MPSIEDAQVVEYFDDLLFHLPFKERFLIRSLVALLELQPLVFIGKRPRLFTQASLEERTENLAAWETSSIFQRRLVFMAIRTILLWAYADSQEVEREMGYVPGTKLTAERKATQAAKIEQMLEPHSILAMSRVREHSLPQEASAKEQA
jgi:hypothetical protein